MQYSEKFLNGSKFLTDNTKSSGSGDLDLGPVFYLKDDLLARIDGILFQVDPVVERLVNYGQEKSAESVNSKI